MIFICKKTSQMSQVTLSFMIQDVFSKKIQNTSGPQEEDTNTPSLSTIINRQSQYK